MNKRDYAPDSCLLRGETNSGVEMLTSWQLIDGQRFGSLLPRGHTVGNA
jgi:hypothetical protein